MCNRVSTLDKTYAENDQWADRPEKGIDFGSIEEAMRAKFKRGLSTNEILVISDIQRP